MCNLCVGCNCTAYMVALQYCADLNTLPTHGCWPAASIPARVTPISFSILLTLHFGVQSRQDHQRSHSSDALGQQKCDMHQNGPPVALYISDLNNSFINRNTN